MVNSWVCFSVNWYLPGKWAAPPAPAIMTSIPLPYADLAKSYIRSGVRCAETIVVCNIQISIIFTFSSNSTRYESRLSWKENGYIKIRIRPHYYRNTRASCNKVYIVSALLQSTRMKMCKMFQNKGIWKWHKKARRIHDGKYNQQRNYMVPD